jgi:hypothetical protein
MLKKLEYKDSISDIIPAQNQDLRHVVKLISGINKIAHVCFHGTP